MSFLLVNSFDFHISSFLLYPAFFKWFPTVFCVMFSSLAMEVVLVRRPTWGISIILTIFSTIDLPPFLSYIKITLTKSTRLKLCMIDCYLVWYRTAPSDPFLCSHCSFILLSVSLQSRSSWRRQFNVFLVGFFSDLTHGEYLVIWTNQVWSHTRRSNGFIVGGI